MTDKMMRERDQLKLNIQEMQKQVQQGYKRIAELLDEQVDLKVLVSKYPNDAQLGEGIRRRINNEYDIGTAPPVSKDGGGSW